MAKGSHLFSFRTQKLSPSALMVLGWTRPGRVGRRRLQLRRAVDARAQLHTPSMRLSRSVLKKQKSHHSLTAILSKKSKLFLFVDRVYRHTFAILLRVVTVRSPRRNRRMHKGICTYSPKRRVRSIPTKRNGVYLTNKYNRLSVLSSSGKEILDN